MRAKTQEEAIAIALAETGLTRFEYMQSAGPVAQGLFYMELLN
jgi:hypothetical protein